MSSLATRTEQWIDAALLVAFVLAAVTALWRGARAGVWRGQKRVIVATVAVCAAALVARLAVCAPDFLHVNFRGLRIVEQILAFPTAGENLDTYGQTSFVVLGVIAKAFGHSFRVIATTNVVFGVMTLGLAGWCAARWTGRAWCAPLAVVVGALQPALVRVASSEDAHGLAVLFGFAALVAIDVYATTRDRAALATAALAAVLMVFTRQTLYVWAIAIVGMAIARGGWSLLRRKEFGVAVAVIVAAVVVRVVTTMRSEPIELLLPALMFSSAGLLGDLLRFHPILDVTRYALLLLPLEILGVVVMARTSPVKRGYFVFLGVVFVVTLPFGFPGPGAECSFRLPAMTLVLVAAAAGAERLMRAGWAPRVLLLAAVISPIALPTWRMLGKRSAPLQEYEYLRAASRLLPERVLFVDIPAREPMPAYRIPNHLLDAAGRRVWRFDVDKVRPEDRAGPMYFLAGIQCRAWSVAELSGLRFEHPTLADLQEFFRAPVAHRIFHDVRAPNTPRPECAALIEGAEPVGPPLVIHDAPSENPFVLYGDAPIVVQLMRIPPSEAPSP